MPDNSGEHPLRDFYEGGKFGFWLWANHPRVFILLVTFVVTYPFLRGYRVIKHAR